MLYLRLGFTESTIICIHYYKHNIDKTYPYNYDIVNWLHTTSGFYDKQFSRDKIDFDQRCVASKTFQEYLNKLMHIIKRSSQLSLNCHKIENADVIDKSKEYFGLYTSLDSDMSFNSIFKLIENKAVLIVNPSSKLMKQQYENGNCQNIHSDFPNLLSIDTYKNHYTFFNRGPNANFHETCEKTCTNIKNLTSTLI